MKLEQFTSGSERIARRYEYDDGTVIAVDFGTSIAEPSVDVVDGTVIVVAENDQYELDLPAETNDAHTFIKNGVLSIELEDEI